MPMKTTRFTGRRARASATWATISALPSWRSSPPRPVMQNTQPTAQPTWVETHRPSRGSSTLSTVWPSASATSRRAEPSSAGCSRLQPRQAREFVAQRRQGGAQRLRQEVLEPAPAAVLRQGLRPAPQHVRLVARPGAELAQALADSSIVMDAAAARGDTRCRRMSAIRLRAQAPEREAAIAGVVVSMPDHARA